MAEHLDVNYEYEENDASSSAFGWDFQANAALFLFLWYIKQAKSVKVETKYQDIEIELIDGKIYAQAKALQNENASNKNENSKLRDALVSLAKVKLDTNDKLLYVSNLRAPIDGDKERFNNSIIKIGDTDNEYAVFIENQIKIIIDRINTINKKKNTSKAQKEKNNILIDKLKKIDVSELLISSIYPFFGEKEQIRYKKIYEETLNTLINVLNIDGGQAIALHKKVCTHWQNALVFNETIKDSDSKKIEKKDFLWTIIAMEMDTISDDIVYDSVDFSVDSYIDNTVKNYLSDPTYVYHERFEFSHIVLKDYIDYCNSNHTRRADEEYLKTKNWEKFKGEFAEISDDHLKELIIKKTLFRIIRSRNDFKKLSEEVTM